ncbi:uncharacterized protein A4U43_C07F30320 [Asparagus officinalis]|uniref:Uncharacterized protein n=1 Tax=Asparagus officinalis TaxID=4686 RepID=A0A5P1EJP8_ASPOF|nr:glucan endo-1,3-beta-glucosidase 2-like [Asparagus officinalis]ONK64821.1 uncharacterized protein A4U43_C07F30320 [Asparagus officinalis]
MVGFYLAFSLLPLLGFNETEVLKLMSFQELKQTTIEVSVSEADIPKISSSVLEAENWLKSRVIFQSPNTKITSISVGKGVLCYKKLEPLWSSVLPSIKNLHSVLLKLEMTREIEISVSLSSDCLEQNQSASEFRGDIPKEMLKPLLRFLQDFNLTYSIEKQRYSQLKFVGMREEAKAMGRKFSS